MGLSHIPLYYACTCNKGTEIHYGNIRTLHKCKLTCSIWFSLCIIQNVTHYSRTVSTLHTNKQMFHVVLIQHHTNCYTLQMYCFHFKCKFESVNVCYVIRVIVDLFSAKPVQMRHHLELIVSKPH